MPRKSLYHFLIAYFVTALPLLVVALNIDQGDVVVLFGAHRFPFLDPLAIYGTYLGDGIAVVVAVAIALLFSYRKAILLTAVGIGQYGMSNLFKKIVFGDTPRPGKFFPDPSIFNPLDGVELRLVNSFPSGHTLTAFSLALAIALLFIKPKYAWLMLLYGWFVAWTRIYLGQHFLQDTLMGSLLGLFTTLIVLAILNPILQKSTVPDRGLLK